MQKSLSRQKIQMVGQKENTWQVLQQCCCIRGTIFQEILDWCCPKAADGRQGEALLPVTSRNAVRKTPLRANTTWKRHQCADQQLLSWAGLCAESRNAARSCCLSRVYRHPWHLQQAAGPVSAPCHPHNTLPASPERDLPKIGAKMNMVLQGAAVVSPRAECCQSKDFSPRDFLPGEEELDGLKSGCVWDELASAGDTGQLCRSFQMNINDYFCNITPP